MKDHIWLFPIFDDTQYDMRNTIVKYWAMRSSFTAGQPDGCLEFRLGVDVQSESELLGRLWAELSPWVIGRTISGWRIYDRIWPILVNRSLVHRIPVPAWARQDPTKRWPTMTFFDLFSIYTQGRRYDSHDKDVTLSQALELWLPDDPLLPDIRPGDAVPPHYGCLCLNAMEKVVRLYEGDQA